MVFQRQVLSFFSAPIKQKARWSLLCAVLAACSGPGDENIVARVGEREITIAQYKEFVDNLPEELESGAAGIDQHLEQLQSLIDKELLVIEAHALGLAQDADFARTLERQRDKRVLDAFYSEVVGADIEVTEAEMRAYFVESGRNRKIKLEILQFANAAEAQAELDMIGASGIFKRSTPALNKERDQALAARIEGQFFTKDKLHRGLRQTAFALQVGEVSAPIQFLDRWLLAKVVDEAAVDFVTTRAFLSRELHSKKYEARKEQMQKELAGRYQLVADAAGLERVVQGTAGLLPRDIKLYSYKGGTITSGRLLDQLANRGLRNMDMSDSTRVANFVHQVLVPEELVLLEARRLGLDTKIVADLEEKREQLLVEELLRRMVKQPVEVTYEDARAYYDANPDIFTSPEYIKVQEILVASQTEALELLKRVQEGEDMGILATANTLRRQGKTTEGQFHFHRFEAPLYGGLVEAADVAPEGELQGPLRVETGYSIFRMLGRERAKSSFDDRQIQFRVKNIVTRIRQNERFHTYVEQLRDKYSDQVRIVKKNLRLVAAVARS